MLSNQRNTRCYPSCNTVCVCEKFVWFGKRFNCVCFRPRLTLFYLETRNSNLCDCLHFIIAILVKGKYGIPSIYYCETCQISILIDTFLRGIRAFVGTILGPDVPTNNLRMVSFFISFISNKLLCVIIAIAVC